MEYTDIFLSVKVDLKQLFVLSETENYIFPLAFDHAIQ